MNTVDGLVILILLVAVMILAYSFLKTKGMLNLKDLNPNIPNFHSKSETESIHITPDGEETKESRFVKVNESLHDVTGKAKSTYKSSTDTLTSKIDAFLDEKSDVLIKDWELATNKDINTLDEKFIQTSEKIESLDERFQKYMNDNNERVDALEKRVAVLEIDE